MSLGHFLKTLWYGWLALFVIDGAWLAGSGTIPPSYVDLPQAFLVGLVAASLW